MELKVYDPAKGRDVICGEIKGDVFIRRVRPEHFMKVMQGYGIQEVGFQELLKRQIRTIAIVEEISGQSHISSISTWIEKGRVADYGHGKQRFVSLKYISPVTGAKPTAPPEPKQEELAF